MSLQIWLPLNGNLHNQGLNPSVFKGASVTYSQGKIGLAAAGTVSSSVSDLTSTSGFTFGLWWNIKDGDTYKINIPIATGQRESSVLSALKMDYSDKTPSHYAIKLTATDNEPQMVWTRDNRAGAEGKWELEKWFHYIVAVENGDFGIKVKIYINGKLVSSYQNSNYNFTLIPGTISLTGTALKNDFRLYDHCLSPKEIEEWSKGLFLHYPLRDSSLQSTRNILGYPTPTKAAGALGWDQSLHQDAIIVSGFANGYNSGVSEPSKGYHAYWKIIDGIPTMVFSNLNGQYGYKNRWLGISSNSFSLNGMIAQGQKYTISFEAKGTIKNKTVKTGLHYTKSGGSSSAFHDNTATFSLSTEWKKYSYTFILKEVPTSTARVYMYGHNTSETQEAAAYVRNLQLEINDHATEYTSGSRVTSQVYDCSGYGNHGTVNGVIQMYPDSARSNYSYYTSDGRVNYIQSNDMIFPTDQITMCCWVKGSETGIGNYHIPLCFGASNYEISLQGSDGLLRSGYVINKVRQCITTSKPKILDEKWHFVASTYDGEVIRRYVDGVECESTAAAGSLTGGTGRVILGNYSGSSTYGNKNLYTSDVRIYATALTAEQIKELYSIGASIDNGGNLYGYDLIEDGNNAILKNGIVSFDDFIEYNIDKFLIYDGELWAHILHHNNRNGTKYFTSLNADFNSEEDLYSRLYLIEQLRGADGSFEFLALQPDDDPDGVYRWIQTNNPNVSTEKEGFKSISGNMTYGLVKCSGATYWAATSTTSNWWQAVGCCVSHNGGVPGFGRKTIKGSLDLYVKLDKQTSFLKDSVEALNYYEF